MISTAFERAERRRRRRRRAERARVSFRADIEGLRAIAVMFVLIWHAGVSWLPGGFVGVDIFFVVSGFLMTSILHREMQSARNGRVDVLAFYARRARRLVPASTLTLVATAVATFLVLPETRWRDIGLDVAAAGGYVVNWVLADRAVDYLAQGTAPSPIQHFWSLSVEEQFYICWPLLLVALAWIAVKGRLPLTPATLTTLVLIAVGSLGWSIYFTETDPGRAYFVTTTRLWELALGGLVALAMPLLGKLPLRWALLLAWAGIAGIFATGFSLTTDMPFPGWVALVPTISTALVIGAGPAAGGNGPVRLFKGKAVQWVGGCSYSMYLWHWPVLIIGGYWITSGTREISTLEGVALVAMSILPAWLSLRYVEDPVRQSKDLANSVRNSMTLAFFGIAISLIAGLVMASLAPSVPAVDYVSKYVAPAGVEEEPIGAELLRPDPSLSPAAQVKTPLKALVLSPQVAPSDNPQVYKNGCHLDYDDTTPLWCEFGEKDSNTRVAVIGDSHAAQWIPALESVALERDWKLLLSTKSACPFIDITTYLTPGQPYKECTAWNEQVEQYLTGPDRPVALVVSYGPYDGSTDEFVRGAQSRLLPIIEQGVRVIVIRDTPVQDTIVPDCLADHLDDPALCATPRAEALQRRDQTQPDVVRALPGAQLVDLTDWICPSDPCSPVIGGVIPFRDDQHLTATYARTLAGPLGEALRDLRS